jgi:hypothetical protein
VCVVVGPERIVQQSQHGPGFLSRVRAS